MLLSKQKYEMFSLVISEVNEINIVSLLFVNNEKKDHVRYTSHSRGFPHS